MAGQYEGIFAGSPEVDKRPEKAVLFCVLPLLLIESWVRFHQHAARALPTPPAREKNHVVTQVREMLQAVLDGDSDGLWSGYWGHDLERLAQNVAHNFDSLLQTQAFVRQARNEIGSLVAVRDESNQKELLQRVCKSGGKEHSLSRVLNIRNRTEARLNELARKVSQDLEETPLLAADLAGVVFRGCLLTGQVTLKELREKERRLLATADGFLPGSTAKQHEHHRQALRDAFWRGGFGDSVHSPRNTLVEMLFGTSRGWIPTLEEPSQKAASTDPLELQWPPGRTAWYSGYTQGMEAARLMRMGPDAPLYSLDTALSFVMPPLCQEACALRVAAWGHFFVTHMELGWWPADGSHDAPGKHQWRESARAAVVLHAKSLLVAELHARLGGIADKKALQRYIIAPMQQALQVAEEHFAHAVQALALTPTHGQKPYDRSRDEREWIPSLTLARAPVDVLGFTATCFAQTMTKRPLPANAAAQAETAWRYYALSVRGAAAALALQAYEQAIQSERGDDVATLVKEHAALVDATYLRHHRGSTVHHHFPHFFAHTFPDSGARDLTILWHAQLLQPLKLANAANLMRQREAQSGQRKGDADGMRRWVYGFLFAQDTARKIWPRHDSYADSMTGFRTVAKQVKMWMQSETHTGTRAATNGTSTALAEFAKQAEAIFHNLPDMTYRSNATILETSV